MFVVEALYPFSAAILKQQQQAEDNLQKDKQLNQQHVEKSGRQQINEAEDYLKQGAQLSRDQAQERVNVSQNNQVKGDNNQADKKQNEQASELSYLTFQKGDKILVLQSYQNGWWYGHTIKQPDNRGFFPSNYIQLTTKPKPPPLPSEPVPDQEQHNIVNTNEERDIDWVQNELKNITQGPVKSDYYLGIKGYKNVKIDEKNQNVLKGDHVKFDVSTGLAKVPVKDQAPMAKAVRQMGYYFDYHQWNQERNKQPGQRARPDPKKKKIKKLNLKGMK